MMRRVSDWSRRANHVTSVWRAVGGKLVVVDGRLSFEPHGFDRALAAQSWSVALDEIREIRVAPRRPLSHAFGAGLRRQLSVVGPDGEAFFVVNGVERVVRELDELRSR